MTTPTGTGPGNWEAEAARKKERDAPGDVSGIGRAADSRWYLTSKEPTKWEKALGIYTTSWVVYCLGVFAYLIYKLIGV